MNTFGERLKELLLIKGMKGTFLAEYVGKNKTAISYYTSNKSYPTQDFFFKIKDLFPELNLNWLIVGQGSMFLGQEQKAEKEQTAKVVSADSDKELENLREMQRKINDMMKMYAVKKVFGESVAKNSSVCKTDRRIIGILPGYGVLNLSNIPASA